MSAPNNEPILKIRSEMKLKTYRFDYELVIDKFWSIRRDGFRSDIFSPPGLNEPKFYIECLRKAEKIDSKFSIGPKVQLTLFACEKKSNVYVKFDIYGMDQNDSRSLSKRASSNGEFNLLSKSILLCENLQGDVHNILCEFTLEIDSFSTQIGLPSFESLWAKKVGEFSGYQTLYKTQQIALDVDTMLSSGKFSDVEIVVGKRSFRAHKFMLAARSPVFAAMFEHDLEESRTNKVEIIDVDEDIFEHLLRYIYANKELPMANIAEKLLVAADKYQLSALKATCEDHVKLSAESMYDVLLLADTYNADKLKTRAIEYISSHFSSYNLRESSKIPFQKLFQNHLTSNLVEAMRSFDKEVKSNCPNE